MQDTSQLAVIVPALVFAVVAIAAYLATAGVARQGRLRQRYASVSALGGQGAAAGPRRLPAIDVARLGVGADAARRLRRDLIRAGVFGHDAVALFTLARLAVMALAPLAGLAFLTVYAAGWSVIAKAGFCIVVAFVAWRLPAAWLSRRQAAMQERYRLIFPDVLDMLVVCVNAGLSLDAALARVTRELGHADRALRANFDLMAGEMRAGKSTADALKDFAERLGLPEARALATLLQQSIELGTDVALALATFSDEMRDKRLAVAEEKAAALPPKLTIPLAMFIFPVVLIVILAPVALKILKAAGS